MLPVLVCKRDEVTPVILVLREMEDGVMINMTDVDADSGSYKGSVSSCGHEDDDDDVKEE